MHILNTCELAMQIQKKSQYQPRRVQAGLTLVELLVAMALSGLIAIAAIAALTMSRQGFSTVDASAQLRDNGRFAASILQRLAVQTGFLDFSFATTRAASEFNVAGSENLPPPIYAVNNAKYTQSLALGITATSPANGVNGSDILVLRYQPGESFPGSNISDSAMINCDGTTSTAIASTSKDQMISVLHIGISGTTNEPALMCTKRNLATGIWLDSQPLVEGVESFQLLFGVDNVVPNTAPTGTTDSIPDRYLRADQLTGSTEEATNANWRRVRSIRMGLVLRGPPGSSLERTIPSQYPLGAPGVMNTAADVGSTFPSQTDGRLRQTISFTVHLRNPQDL